MNNNDRIPLQSAVAIANGLGRYGRKSTPHRSPTAAQVQERDLVFQVDMITPNGIEHKSKVISGESLLMALKRRVTAARQNDQALHTQSHSATQSASMELDSESETKPRERQPTGQFKPHGSTVKSSKPKGPCQACQELSEGCMRKAFGWPLSDAKIYYDKGRPFVYLCNKCGLRYNKSNGCVCRNCRWVLCKEDKRKAMHFIDVMRAKRPDGYLDPEEEIEGFLCPPKYWKCNRPWKVGWVLNTN
ncbi:hypothetical protein BGW37DRAFT_422546 [Umbelopsis sp. PMI_123]|nr:hypothetical protein BGW37DRAFT_422546 [Umbelopsis sp. PMI_123]